MPLDRNEARANGRSPRETLAMTRGRTRTESFNCYSSTGATPVREHTGPGWAGVSTVLRHTNRTPCRTARWKRYRDVTVVV